MCIFQSRASAVFNCACLPAKAGILASLPIKSGLPEIRYENLHQTVTNNYKRAIDNIDFGKK